MGFRSRPGRFEREKIRLPPAGTGTSDRPARSLITIATTVSRPPYVFCEVKSL